TRPARRAPRYAGRGRADLPEAAWSTDRPAIGRDPCGHRRRSAYQPRGPPRDDRDGEGAIPAGTISVTVGRRPTVIARRRRRWITAVVARRRRPRRSCRAGDGAKPAADRCADRRAVTPAGGRADRRPGRRPEQTAA